MSKKLFKVQFSGDAKDKPFYKWDGKGKHPVLGLTKEEIIALNESVTDRRFDDRSDNPEKAPLPTFEEEIKLQTNRNQENIASSIENLANTLLTTDKS